MAKKQGDDGRGGSETRPHEPQGQFEIRLKPGHPTGVYHRAGFAFTASAPVVLDHLPDAVANDPWLLVTTIEGSE